ncbi:MAG: hypothetical protein BM559_11970 [Roseobacter sp. MedPE-SWchi]|nr:MAG: hypothetical protein BM559_11970 [Roseobacter sp. MedPE-SWchi]
MDFNGFSCAAFAAELFDRVPQSERVGANLFIIGIEHRAGTTFGGKGAAQAQPASPAHIDIEGAGFGNGNCVREVAFLFTGVRG